MHATCQGAIGGADAENGGFSSESESSVPDWQRDLAHGSGAGEKPSRRPPFHDAPCGLVSDLGR